MNHSKIRITSIFIMIFLLVHINSQGQSFQEKYLKIIYIANAGFLIEYNSKKILIDALHSWPNFESTPDEVWSGLLNNKPPFNDIDLILVTHDHADHFGPKIVKFVMSRQKNAVLIAPPNAVESLINIDMDGFGKISDKQIRSIDLQIGDVIELSENSVDLKIFGLDHGGPSNMINFAFLIKIDDKTLFHKGDSEVNDEFFESNNFSAEKIDILFAQEYAERLNKIIVQTKPNHIVYQHIRPMDFVNLSKTIRENHPDIIIFEKPMENRVFK